TPMGCLATHAAWHHPRTQHLMQEAGIAWLTRVAGLNPATSLVIREWDTRAGADWQARAELLKLFCDERESRAHIAPGLPGETDLVSVAESAAVTPGKPGAISMS